MAFMFIEEEIKYHPDTDDLPWVEDRHIYGDGDLKEINPVIWSDRFPIKQYILFLISIGI